MGCGDAGIALAWISPPGYKNPDAADAAPVQFGVVDKITSGNYNIIMDGIRFEWDPKKNEINKEKHHVSFEEAQTVFYDDEAKVIDDPEHSWEEDRFIILGFSKKANLLVVCHCYRASETVIRIISARKATKNESAQYFS